MRHPPRANGLRLLLGLLLVLGVACTPATRYGVGDKEKDKDKDPKEQVEDSKPVPPHYAWYDAPLHPDQSGDRPIRFVGADDKRWEKLPAFWNDPRTTPIVGGLVTTPLGLTPVGPLGGPHFAQLGTVAGLLHVLDADVVLVKVPLGLPDPTPHFPVSNPPTVARWTLGKKLFFDEGLLPLTSKVGQGCITCHHPKDGFTLRQGSPSGRDVLSLINVVYNKQQFWDGRVDYLEQVLQRDLSDERGTNKSDRDNPGLERRHIWSGVITRLAGRKDYRADFEGVFGTPPNIDNVGKALATYLRTLLSGGSIYDLAEKTRREDKAKPTELTAKHFEPHLYHAVRKKLDRESLDAKGASEEMELGYRLFVKSRCNQCHGGPLFTDQGYHNTGVGDSSRGIIPHGTEPGRFAVLPLGLKDSRFIGAYRTPTLRNLPRSAPYLHDGSMEKLEDVLKYYNSGVSARDNRHLDPALKVGAEEARQLNLSAAELRALEFFLRGLDGDDIPTPLVAETKK